MAILIRGDGIAARCCWQLLGSAGFALTHETTPKPRVPVLMISGRAQRLMCDVFQREDLFHGLPQIEARIVQWEKASAPLRLPHSAVVVAEDELLGRLNSSGSYERGLNCQPHWTIFASRPLPEPNAEHRFGTRVATVLPVDLAGDVEDSACWIESLPTGWLFLLPAPRNKAWLLAVGGAHDSLLAESRLVQRQIGSLGACAGKFPAYPAMADPLCGPGWLACGSGALAFDPLCGDGIGNALREAILASAVICAAFGGEPEAGLLDHYRTRLLQGFRRHLQICRGFYSAARQGPWWDAEIQLIRQGLEYCERQAGNPPRFRYRLQGYELRAV